jgi:hypothetical protein
MTIKAIKNSRENYSRRNLTASSNFTKNNYKKNVFIK